MEQILFINACVRGKEVSRTYFLASQFLKTLKEQGYEFVFIEDLILKDNYEIKHDGTQCKIEKNN